MSTVLELTGNNCFEDRGIKDRNGMDLTEAEDTQKGSNMAVLFLIFKF